jgi:predicted TIM-barrel fold metal-dependent hydrolase
MSCVGRQTDGSFNHTHRNKMQYAAKESLYTNNTRKTYTKMFTTALGFTTGMYVEISKVKFDNSKTLAVIGQPLHSNVNSYSPKC